MTQGLQIRESIPGDNATIRKIYPAAFPEEDLLPVVSDLLDDQSSVLSLVAIADGVPAGHICFSTCGIAAVTDRVALLGPLAVAPALHGEGIGSALIRDGFVRLKKAGITRVFVLGDPAYYSRFGFMPEADVTPPYALPDEWRDAWQSVSLTATVEPPSGILSVPPPWREPALWGP